MQHAIKKNKPTTYVLSNPQDLLSKKMTNYYCIYLKTLSFPLKILLALRNNRLAISYWILTFYFD